MTIFSEGKEMSLEVEALGEKFCSTTVALNLGSNEPEGLGEPVLGAR